jgi:hypothetical protein
MRSRLVFALSSALLANLVFVSRSAAQPAAAYPPDTRFHTLKVTVVDAVTKQPLSGAELSANLGSTEPTKIAVDASGVGTLAVPVNLPGTERITTFVVAVSHPNYASRQLDWFSDAGGVRETLPADYTVGLRAGVAAGGVVRDEKGAPVAGAKITMYGSASRGHMLGRGEKTQQEYGYISIGDADALVTDAQGAWRRENFPGDLTRLNLTVIRPGGARVTFDANEGEFRPPLSGSTSIALADVTAGKVVLALKAGKTVRGLVVDEAGKPVNGVQLRARDGVRRGLYHEFTNDLDGSFALPNWDNASVLVTAERAGYRAKTITIPLSEDSAPGKIVLAPAKPLRLRVVDENNTPVVGAEALSDPNNVDQLLRWKATTDADGRVTWDSAPDMPVTVWVMSRKDNLYRNLKILADGEEHLVRIRRGAEKAIVVQLKVVDEETAAPSRS